jgi:hypothetical protein
MQTRPMDGIQTPSADKVMLLMPVRFAAVG